MIWTAKIDVIGMQITARCKPDRMCNAVTLTRGNKRRNLEDKHKSARGTVDDETYREPLRDSDNRYVFKLCYA
jgi:hypothetical protein